MGLFGLFCLRVSGLLFSLPFLLCLFVSVLGVFGFMFGFLSGCLLVLFVGLLQFVVL